MRYMPWMSRWPRKSSRHTSTANAEDESVNALLAQAAYIMQNPDEFLVEAEVEAQAEVVDEAVLV